VALQHNFGLGSAAVVTLYRKYDPHAPTENSLNARKESKL